MTTEDISTKYSSKLTEETYDELENDIETIEHVPLNKFDIISHEKTYDKYMSSLNSRVSLPYITKYEKAKLLGIRAQQIASGSVPLIDIEDKINVREIVKEELRQKKMPLIVRRFLPDGRWEDWKLTDFKNIN